MLISLYGSDTYRRDGKARDIEAEYRKKHSALTVARFDLEEEGAAERLDEFLARQSLFGEHKLAVARNAPADVFAKFPSLRAASQNTATHLILVSEGGVKDAPRESRAQEFGALDDAAFSTFVQSEAAARGLTLTPSTVWALRAACADLWCVVTELDKLVLGGTLEAREGPLRFFSLIQALAHRPLVGRLTALEHLIREEDSAKVFNVCASVVPGAAKAQMADYDVAVKSGTLEYEEALLDFALGTRD